MSNVRKMTVVSIFGAISAILMLLEFSVPFVPVFLKFDFSDIPALIVSFAAGPVSGMSVCLLKNLLHLFFTHTGGVGEFANLIISTAFVVPAGLVYIKRKNKKFAVLGAFSGSVVAAFCSLPVNYFITYPFYARVMMPEEVIVGMYSDILPAADTLLKSLIIFNMPFTLIKGLLAAVVCMLVYKPLSPILKGKR